MRLFAILFLLSASAPPPIGLLVAKRLGLEPMDTVAEIRIPRHADNRAACVTLNGPLPNESCWDLSDGSAPVFTRTWTGLVAGHYRAQARLLRGRDVLFSNAVELTVLGEEP